LNYSKRKQKINKEIEHNERKNTFINSEDYKLLTDFLKKYKPFTNYPDKIESLQEVLERKGHPLSHDLLIELFEEELEKTRFQEFSSPILKHNPEKLEDYIMEFLNLYDETYNLYLDDFMKLLGEKGLKEETADFKSIVVEKIEKRKKEKNLQKFERGLSLGEDTSALKDDETSS
jgi:hypothetical protein